MATRTPLLRSADLSPEIVSKFSGANAAANVGLVSTIQDAGQKLVIKQAFAWSMRNMWIFYTCVGAIAVVASFFIKRETLNRDVHIETKTGLQQMGEKEREDEIELRTVV